MRILFLITRSDIGGAQRFVQEQMHILTKYNVEVFLVTNKEGWLTEQPEISLNKTGLHRGINTKFPISISFMIFLKNYIRQNQIDLVICNSANAGFYGRIVAYYCKIKSIYVSHGWSSVYNGGHLALLLNKIEKWLARISSSVLCVSDTDYLTGLQTIGIAPEKLQLITNSVLPVKVNKSNSKSEKIRILVVCRLDHPKRVDLLIDAIKPFLETVTLTIVGGGINSKYLRKKIQDEKIYNVSLKGRISRFEDYGSYSIFALISESEGLPISALEAMGAGLPLILSNVGGCKTIIDGNGVLVDNNPTSITAAIATCINNLQRFQKRSLDIFQEKFNLEKNSHKYLDYYRSVIENR